MSSMLSTKQRQSSDRLGTTKRMSSFWALFCKQWAEILQPMIVLSCGSAILFVLIAWLNRNQQHGGWAYGIAMVFSCGFALATCFVAFVMESENRTREFLRNVPVSSVHVGGVKLLVAALAVAVFYTLQTGMALAAVWLQATFSDGAILQVGPAGEPVGILKHLYVVAIPVAIVFVSSSISCSFWSSSWMSVVFLFPLIYLLIAGYVWLSDFFENAPEFDTIERYLTVSMVVPAAALVAGIWLPLVWLRRRPMLWKRSATGVPMEHQEKIFFWESLPGKLGVKTPSWIALPGKGRFRALCWQSFRQQMLLPWLALLAFTLLAGLFWLSNDPILDTRRFREMRQLKLVIVMMITGYGFGWATLYRDKLNSNLNFFQQHQEHGRELLLARVLFPLLLLLATAGFGSYVTFLFTGFGASLLLSLLSGLAAFSATLMGAMVFRSHVYALGVGLVLVLTMNVFISSWSLDQGLEYRWMAGLPFLWLASCFAYAPAWLSGRRSAPWMAWFTLVSLAVFSVPLWLWVCWILGLDAST